MPMAEAHLTKFQAVLYYYHSPWRHQVTAQPGLQVCAPWGRHFDGDCISLHPENERLP